MIVLRVSLSLEEIADCKNSCDVDVPISDRVTSRGWLSQSVIAYDSVMACILTADKDGFVENIRTITRFVMMQKE